MGLLNHFRKLELKILKGAENFYKTNAAFIFFSFYIIFFGLLQIILFSLGMLEINGVLNTDQNAWIGWTYLAISIPATALGLIGFIFTIRKNKKFLIPIMSSQFIFLFTNLLGGLIWTTFSILLSMFTVILRYHLINKNGVHLAYNTKLNYFLSFLGFGIFLVMGLILINTSAEIIWWNDVTTTWVKYVDVISASIVLLGNILLILRSKYAFLTFIIADILFIIILIYLGQILTVVSVIVAFFTNLLALLSWHYYERSE